MRVSPGRSRLRAVRPVLEGLETRAMLSHVAVPMAAIAAPGAVSARAASIIGQLPKAPLNTVSTVPAQGDVNPYGVTFVPSGFPSGGVIHPGDVLVSNWNNSANVQGTGTTIVQVTPQNKTALFYQGPPGVGVDTALGILQAGYVLVGAAPASFGTALPLGMGSLLVLDKNGKVVANMTDPQMLDGPWDLTINDLGSTAQIFVANVLSGTVSRFNVSLPTSGGFQVTSDTQIASGYKHHGDPNAVEVGPTGLAFNPATGTLYVASTADNKIYTVKNAGAAGTQSGRGKVIYQDQAHLHGPLALTLLPNGNLMAAQGDAVNPSKRLTSELVEFTPRGKFVGQFSLSKTAGGAFGVASSPDGTRFAAVNDITNTVEIWQVNP
jgi:hypothetical protein